ncbi:hypothetical protein IP86_02965 [Rhodopseudomonas sp. AAP120]|uniref:transglycosylase SLT domain-containing protein n=1 Tax=Rhodopseudomonas sp. AAP120 TaxID=1523430 RepID=UPI0006B94A31|nr:transglycosylase SLT domain-containing protein [Rhodopseudomonas sp. AAP120]KPG01785.1 hypothetical protein IP86_02965 [Rhodopseudomonas sp. AAP120]
MVVPIYISTGEPSATPPRALGLQALPDQPGGQILAASSDRLAAAMGSEAGALSRVGEAQAGLGRAEQQAGGAMVAFSVALTNAKNEAVAANAHTDYLTRLQSAQQKWENSQDYLNASSGFAQDRQQAETDALEQITDPEIRAKTQLQMRRVGLTAQSAVDRTSLSRMVDAQRSGLDVKTDEYTTLAAIAPSPVEQQAYLKNLNEEIDRNAATGVISQADAVKRKLTAASTIDYVRARSAIMSNPDGAAAALADPEQFPGLGAVQRQQLIEQAHAQRDGLITRDLTRSAATGNGAGAIATVGIVQNPAQMSLIFDRGILAIETAGDPASISPKGAAGLAQIMPGTARDLLRARGRDDLAALDDAALTAKLTENGSRLSVELGRDYWMQMGRRYAGDVPVMAAAYNAGPGNADRWLQAANEKFGPHFTAEQFASVIDYKETRDYVGRLYTTLGAPMNAAGLSPSARYQASGAVGAAVAQEDAARRQMYKADAASSRDAADFGEMFRQGQTPDPVAYGSALHRNTLAAQAGDSSAAEWLTKTQFQERMAPVRDAGYRMPPAQLADTVARIEADQRSRPVTQDEIDRLGVLKETLADVGKRASNDPVGLAERAKLIGMPVTVDPQARADDPAFAASLVARSAHAQTAQAYYQGEFKVLKPAEEAAFRNRWASASADDKAALLRTAGASLPPPAFRAFIGQVAGDDNKSAMPVLTLAAGLHAADPTLGASLLEGIKAQKTDDRYVPDSGANKLLWQKRKDELLPAAAFNRAARTDPEGPLAAMSAAIDARYAFLSAQANDTSGSINSARIKQAAEDVTGGVLAHNGAPVLAPWRGASQRDLDATLTGLTDADLADARTTGGKPIGADYVRSQAKLTAFGDGRYLVQVNRNDDAPQYAATAAGRPFVLDLRNRARGAPPAVDPFNNGMPLP